MADTGTHLDVTVFVDKKKRRVLFAEADGHFVDILFSFLTLPLGTIIRLIGKTPSEPATIGCLGALYQSVMSLGSEHFYSEEYKDMLLHPRSSSERMCQELAINVDDTEAEYFLCSNYSSESSCSNFMSLYDNTACPGCRKSMSTVTSLPPFDSHIYKNKVFVTKAFKFIITDDLQVTPVVPGTVIDLLDKLGINDMSAIVERTVSLGLNEFLELLKLTLLSTTPLTDHFGGISVPKKISVQETQCADRSQGYGKINVEVVLRKSNKEFLFVEARQDFIDFLFSFLMIPLGEALHIMEGKSCMGSIDGLYKSALSLDSQYILDRKRNILIRPKLAPHFTRIDNIFPLASSPVTLYVDGAKRTMPVDSKVYFGPLRTVGFLKEEAVFFVHDNLAVTPYSAASAISIFKRNKVSVSDLEKRTLSIGLAEGISILRASLCSSTAISKGLLHKSNLIFKVPKEEKD